MSLSAYFVPLSVGGRKRLLRERSPCFIPGNNKACRVSCAENTLASSVRVRNMYWNAKKRSGLALGTTHLAQTLGVDLVSKGNSEAWEFKVVQTAAFFDTANQLIWYDMQFYYWTRLILFASREARSQKAACIVPYPWQRGLSPTHNATHLPLHPLNKPKFMAVTVLHKHQRRQKEKTTGAAAPGDFQSFTRGNGRNPPKKWDVTKDAQQQQHFWAELACSLTSARCGGGGGVWWWWWSLAQDLGGQCCYFCLALELSSYLR